MSDSGILVADQPCSTPAVSRCTLKSDRAWATQTSEKDGGHCFFFWPHFSLCHFRPWLASGLNHNLCWCVPSPTLNTFFVGQFYGIWADSCSLYSCRAMKSWAKSARCSGQKQEAVGCTLGYKLWKGFWESIFFLPPLL